MQRIAQQGPPLSPWCQEPDVVKRDAAALAGSSGFPDGEPARVKVAPRADHLDVVTCGTFQVLADFGTEPGGSAYLTTG
jgi:hypothetical protein